MASALTLFVLVTHIWLSASTEVPVHIYYPFTAYGGTWTLLSTDIMQGVAPVENTPKILVSAMPEFTDGTVSVELMRTAGWCAGLGLRVSAPSTAGWFSWNGYNVIICDQILYIQKLGGTFDELLHVPNIDYISNTWVVLAVTMAGPSFTVRLNGAVLATVADTTFASGTIALKTWDATAQFRNLMIATATQTLLHDFAPSPSLQADTCVDQVQSLEAQKTHLIIDCEPQNMEQFLHDRG